MQKILLRTWLLFSENKLDLNNIIYIQEFAIVKLKDCLQNLFNKI